MKKAVATRAAILEKAFELIYVNGYQATSIDDIIATTQVTKGAFFYYFKNKEEMGLAMIKEIMEPPMRSAMIASLIDAEEPTDALYNMMRDLLLANPYMQVKYGCPANNLIQEMAPLNRAFQEALVGLVTEWQQAIENCIDAGRRARKIRKDVVTKEVAMMIMAGYGGIRNLGKVYNSTDCYKTYLASLMSYLESLK